MAVKRHGSKMFRLFKKLKPMAKFFVIAVILLFASALAELYLPGMMSDIINDGIFLDYEPMYEHETMINPFGEIDITGDVDGFEKDKIPVFEMKDGFSTVDIKNVWNEQFNAFPITFNFMDIPVRDSKELFNDVLLPFMNSLKEYQFDKISKRYGYTVNSFNDYSPADKEKVKEAVAKLIDYDSILRATDAGAAINLNTFLDIFKYETYFQSI